MLSSRAAEVGHFASVARREGGGGVERSGPTHANVGFELTWVERGTIRFVIGKRALEASAGGCVLLPPGIEHTPRSARVTMHQLTLAPSFVADAERAFGGSSNAPREARVVGAHETLARLTAMVAEEAMHERAAHDPTLRSLVQATAFALVRDGGASPRGRDPRVLEVIERMQRELSSPLRIDELARRAGMDRWSFSRLFRGQVGESPLRYLTSLRLTEASRQLRETRRSVLEISLRCGFPSPSRLAAAFRARFGRTPRAFRAHTP